MARIDQNGTLAQTRGKQGGVVVSSNASGGYVRSWVMPRRPLTYDQWLTAVQFRNIAKMWSELPAGDKADWSAEAESTVWERADWFGQPYQPSGLNLYMMIWTWYYRLGGTTAAPLPSGSLPVATLNFTVATDGAWTTWANNNILLTASQSPAGSYRYVLFDADLRRGTGSDSMRGNYRPLEQWDLNDGATKTLYGGNAAAGSCFFRNLVMPWRAVFLTEDLKPSPPIIGTYRSPVV